MDDVDWEKLLEEIQKPSSFWRDFIIPLKTTDFSMFPFIFNQRGGSFSNNLEVIYMELKNKLTDIYKKDFDTTNLNNSIETNFNNFKQAEINLYSSMNDLKNCLIIFEIIDNKNPINLTDKEISDLSNIFKQNIIEYDNSRTSLNCLKINIIEMLKNPKIQALTV